MENHAMQLRSPVLPRRRLTAALEAVTARKLALITAPGGYGKTTLIREFALLHAGAAFCWVSLDPADMSLPIFLQQLARVLARHLPHGGLCFMSPDRTPTNPAEVRHLGRQFAIELGQHTEDRLVIVLDDLHHVAGVGQVMSFLDAFIQYLPESVHLIIASRIRPHLPLARLEARDQLVHLTARDLSFTPAEIRQFFCERFHLALPLDVLSLLARHTEGWVTALQLLGNLLQAMPPESWHGFLERFPVGGALFDFLAEEVFLQQPTHLQQFLLGTCVLSTLQPFVIERMLGVEGAGALLQELEARNLLAVLEVGVGAYRYHPLFQAFLQQQLRARRGEAEMLRLRVAAAQVYESMGDLAEAVEQYLSARANAQAATLMAEQVDTVLKSLRTGVVKGWLDRVPADLFDTNPDVIYVRAQVAGWQAQHDILPVLYQRCLELYDQQENYRAMARCLSWVTNRFWKLRTPYFQEAPDYWAGHPDFEVRIYGRILQAFTHTWRGEWDVAFAQLQALLGEIPPATRAYFDSLEALAVLSFWRGDGKSCLRYGLPQTAGRTALGDFTWGIYNWVSYCLLADPMGLEIYHRQYLAQEVPPAVARMHELVGTLGQAIIHLYHRRWEDALACFESLRPHFTDNRSGFRTLGSEASFTAQYEMARIYARLGRRDDAWLCLKRNLELAAGYPEVAALAHASMAEFLAAEGDVAEARSHLAKAVAVEVPGLRGLTTVAVAVAAGKVALADGDRQRAREAFTRALDVVRQRECPWYLLHIAGPEILPVLIEIARDPLPVGAPAVLQTIALLGEQGPKLLAPFLGHSDPAVKAAVATLLEQVHPGDAQGQVPVLRVYGIGPLRVYRYDQPVESPDWHRTKVKLLLIILLLRRGRPLPKDLLTEMLWPAASPAAARNSLRATVHGLKRALEPDLGAGAPSRYLLSDRETLALGAMDEIWFDLWEFEDLVSRARSAQRSGREDEAAQLSEEACHLYRGGFLPESAFAEHFLDVRSRTEQAYLSACLHVAGTHLAGGDYRTAVEYARRALVQDRALEEAYQVLIQAYLTLGERERALQAYKTCRKHMRQMLGSEPSAGTRRLLEA